MSSHCRVNAPAGLLSTNRLQFLGICFQGNQAVALSRRPPTASSNPTFSNHNYFQKSSSIDSSIYREFQNRPNTPPPRLKTTKRRPLRTVAAPNRQTSPFGLCRTVLDGAATPCSGLTGRFAPRLVLSRLTSPQCPAWQHPDFGGSGDSPAGHCVEQFQATASLHRTPPEPAGRHSGPLRPSHSRACLTSKRTSGAITSPAVLLCRPHADWTPALMVVPIPGSTLQVGRLRPMSRGFF